MSTYVGQAADTIYHVDELGDLGDFNSIRVIKLREAMESELNIKCPELVKPIQKWQRSGKRRMPKPR